MTWVKGFSAVLGLLLISIHPASPNPNQNMGTTNKHTSDMTYSAEKSDLSGIASIFSPRMNFDQWKPLTGRGDPLRNDPTYDYEPPVLERVHYWIDESRPEREKFPERKSEVLVLGVSSRKPSVAPRPPAPVRRHPRPPPFTTKYEDFSYKFSDHYPMTILVPPPPPPPGHKPNLFLLSEDLSIPTVPSSASDPTRETTIAPEIITTYALQEANLIYQSSTLKQNWMNYNKTTNLPRNTVSSDYAGWGPTTPFEENDSHNIISHTDNNNYEFTKEPLSFYKPVLSEAPPPPPLPPQDSYNAVTMPNFLPTVLPPTLSTVSETKKMKFLGETAQPEIITDSPHYNFESTTENKHTLSFHTAASSMPKPNVIGMLGPMISMPMVTDPDRPEDNLYAHASDNIHIFKDPASENNVNLEIMQTMQPPPPAISLGSTSVSHGQHFHVNPHRLNDLLHEKPTEHTHDPYLHMRYTTPMSTKVSAGHDVKAPIESISSYLIIQGHSKVKTYGSKPKPNSELSNNIVNPNETNEVKHLHPIKEQPSKKSEKPATNRESRSQNLKSLIETGLGSIEIQETDLGIKYDVSDGSEVPAELYRKGIVETDENNYHSSKKNDIEKKNSF